MQIHDSKNYKFTHRPLKEEDAALIATFPQSATELFWMYPKGIYPFQPEQLLETASQRHLLTVFEIEGKVSGYANIVEFEQDSYAIIGNVIVSPDGRGTGIGEYIIETMIAQSIEAWNIKEARLTCFSNNERGLQFYYKAGFQPTGMQPDKDHEGRHVTRLFLSKNLLSSPQP